MKSLHAPLAIGILAGALGGLMGVGGGILLVPLLVHFMGRGQHEAQATSLAFIIVTSILAAVPYVAAGRADLLVAASLAVGGVPGVMAGARWARATPALHLRRGFGVVVLFAAARLLVSVPTPAHTGSAWHPGAFVVIGFVVGVVAGLLGVGGGTILVPILVLAGWFDQHLAQGISLLMIVPIGIVGAISYARHGMIPRAILPRLLAGGALGALAGGFLAQLLSMSILTRLFGVFLVPVGVHMLLGAGRGGMPAASKPHEMGEDA